VLQPVHLGRTLGVDSIIDGTAMMIEAPAHGGALLADPVSLAVPATRGHVRVARLTAAVVAERLDFDIEEIDDVLVAIDELTNALLLADPVSEITFRFTHLRGVFVAEGSATVVLAPFLSDLARQLLVVVVDSYELSEIDGAAHFRLSKRSPGSF
jgi:hypothetical protein